MANIDKIKKAIHSNISGTYALLYRQGRKKVLIRDCVLEAAYPEIFVLSHSDTRTKRIVKLSFSYTELLTRSVLLCPESSNSMPDVM